MTKLTDLESFNAALRSLLKGTPWSTNENPTDKKIKIICDSGFDEDILAIGIAFIPEWSITIALTVKSSHEDAVNPLHEDAVNPSHYKSHPSGVECIEITQHMTFNLGNVIKYLWRSDLKGHPVEDLKKAAWYLKNEIDRLEKQ